MVSHPCKRCLCLVWNSYIFALNFFNNPCTYSPLSFLYSLFLSSSLLDSDRVRMIREQGNQYVQPQMCPELSLWCVFVKLKRKIYKTTKALGPSLTIS